jgi:hypothetical protein
MRIATWIAAIALIVLPARALAWGPEGHHIVARLAYERLTPKAKAEFDALMTRSAEQQTPACPVAKPEDVGTWADCVRPMHARFDAMAPLHYEHRPMCGTAPPEITCPDGRCVTAEIGRARAVLKDRTRAPVERLQALEEVVHFVADMHQPLHTGDLVDDGGIKVPVAGPVKSSNLHIVWDVDVVETALGTDDATAEASLRPMMAANAKLWSAGEVEAWFTEAHDIAKTSVYPKLPKPPACGQVAPKQTLDKAYLAGASPIVREQLAKASLRLAKVLNQALD